jgi:CspA family cold shock protein
MPNGQCKFYNHTKGYGFLVPDDGGPDVFVHTFELKKSNIRGLLEGERLSFDIEPGREGKPKATNLAMLTDRKEAE